jgi:hypothetical protein
MTRTPERDFYGWKLVFVLWLLDFLNMGFPLYGGAVINSNMLKDIRECRCRQECGIVPHSAVAQVD